MAQASLYYLLTRGWIDFLLETSQNLRIFSELTQALKAGYSLQDWLTANAAMYNLPDQMDQLELAFAEWSEVLASSD